MVYRKTLSVVVLVLWNSSCLANEATSTPDEIRVESKSLRLPSSPFRYDAIPEALPRRELQAFDNTPEDNPITNHGATLGRVLFYDTKLSVNDSTSCASCHQQKHAFSDPRPKSIGFSGARLARNSMSLVNVRYHSSGKMFWDERAESLEEQVLMPIQDPLEMGNSLPKLVAMLSKDPLYRPLFEDAFGDDRVTPDRIARALAQFVRSIVSFQSRYDKGRSQVDNVFDPFPNFTAQENLGKDQFFGRGRCASCHLEDPDEEFEISDEIYDFSVRRNPLRQSTFFLMKKPTVNGIDSEDAQDAGVAIHSNNRDDRGKFKAPSLRNVEVTGPYMHDGRFRTLDAVIEHYNWSVRPHINLDKRLQTAVSGIALPEREKVALAAFLCTLTDDQLLNDRRFSDPFVRTTE